MPSPPCSELVEPIGGEGRGEGGYLLFRGTLAGNKRVSIDGTDLSDFNEVDSIR